MRETGPVDAAELQGRLDEVFDQALIYHGFTDYMRDYEMIVHCPVVPGTGREPEVVRLLFKYCVVVEAETALPADVRARSLDGRLVRYESAPDLAGYLWVVRWQDLYPGGSVVHESERAEEWTRALGIEFHEVRFEMNVHNLTLVFSVLERDEVPVGYAPFVVEND